MSSKAAAPTFALTIALLGCGGGHHSTASSSFSADQVPLVPGTKIVGQARQCDRGVSPFCALELVVVDHGVRSSGDLVTLEGRLLHRVGWSKASGDAGNESGADSPSQKLHVSYGTALADLTGSGIGWFKRASGLARLLSGTLLAHVPAMALTLQTGPA